MTVVTSVKLVTTETHEYLGTYGRRRRLAGSGPPWPHRSRSLELGRCWVLRWRPLEANNGGHYMYIYTSTGTWQLDFLSMLTFTTAHEYVNVMTLSSTSTFTFNELNTRII